MKTFGTDGMAPWMHEFWGPYKQLHTLNEENIMKDTYNDSATKTMLLQKA